MSVTYPQPLINAQDIEDHVLEFITMNPEGVRNSDVGRAIGYNDSRQWFSYGVLDRLIRANKVRKDERSLYFVTAK